jgi:Flagellar assembly protein T, C-terminal domain/Curli production assembly/transport component CsgG
MRLRFMSLFSVMLVASSLALAQPPRRIAVMEANGQIERAYPILAFIETNVTNALTSKLTGQPGLIVIDRASVDKLLKEQNFQNSDRSSAETAARIGKLLGTGQIVLVQLDGASYTTHDTTESGNTIRTTGTVILAATARLIDVETGVILTSPSSSYQDSVVVAEKSTSKPMQFGTIQVPAKQKTTGGDPAVIQANEYGKAQEAVTQELAAKLMTAMKAAPTVKAASTLVAGIAGGSVYIGQGLKAGVKVGDKFQVVREVATGLTNPTNGKPIVHKQQVCVLTIASVDDDDASGTCQGGLPQKNDIAEPMP